MVRNLTIITVASFLLLSASLLHAQDPGKYTQRYEPRRPTLSPYLNYFRSDVGITDRYNALVRPRQRLREELNRQEYNMQRLSTRISTVDREVQQRIRQPQVAPTGTGSTFMNYSHYYSLGNRGGIPSAGRR